MDAPQDPWVPAPRDGGRADIRAGGGAGGDPWGPTVPFPRVAPALERMDAPAPSAALVPAPRRRTDAAVCDTPPPGIVRTCVRAVARLVHVAAERVRSLAALLAAAPVSR
ncbi:hypothetical protein PHK61_23870 [Actinomycetospora lutea]|uniref:hypothetical protein n=1 Tax=Actinomycetospora lutea TaxID=663604 RepID=UPI0023652FA9|nr:hypothetical protein [Actinomycetospora lutea]MDD7941465.1 hypothetical protein [Actinomycetospora lutea]